MLGSVARSKGNGGILGRRHLLALPAVAALPERSLRDRLLPVTCAVPALRPLLAALGRQLAAGSAFRLVEGPGGATLGGLAFGPQPPGPALAPFAGLPYGMAGPDLAGWLATAEGRALWTGGFAARGLRALPCGLALAPGLLRSRDPVTHWAGLRVRARPDGLLGRGLRRLGARPVPAGATAHLPFGAAAPSGHAVRVAPPFAALLELAWPEGLLAPPLTRALEAACAATWASGSPDLPPAPPAALDLALAPALAAAMAEALADCLAMPEAVALRAGPRFAAARLATLRFDPWS